MKARCPATLATLLAVSKLLPLTLAQVMVLDDQGEDGVDQGNDPGNSQYDLTAVTVGTDGTIGWAWDQTALSGANSIDACNHYEVQSDMSVIQICYSVEFNKDGSVKDGFPQFAATECDGTYKPDQQKCTSKNPPASSEYTVTCTDPMQVAPYFEGDDDDDLEASCTISPFDGDLVFLHTCSKTSQSTSSNSNDCIFNPPCVPTTIDFNADSFMRGDYIGPYLEEYGLTITCVGCPGGQNKVRIFDTDIPVGKFGITEAKADKKCAKNFHTEPGDCDLKQDDVGNAIIIDEKGNNKRIPDDNAGGGTIIFVWDQPIQDLNFVALDLDEKITSITLSNDSQSMVVEPEAVEDGGLEYFEDVNLPGGISEMELVFKGSGAIAVINWVGGCV